MPYGVIVETYWEFENKKEKTFPKSKLTHDMLGYYIGEEKWKYNTHFLPFLRPMSSMTEEEKREYNSFIKGQQPFDSDFSAYPIEHKFVYEFDIKNYIDWMNKHHFDYRGLIEKGLALVAPKGMYD